MARRRGRREGGRKKRTKKRVERTKLGILGKRERKREREVVQFRVRAIIIEEELAGGERTRPAHRAMLRKTRAIPRYLITRQLGSLVAARGKIPSPRFPVTRWKSDATRVRACVRACATVTRVARPTVNDRATDPDRGN